MKRTRESLSKELASLLNRYSMENGSNTPDYILAEYLIGCLIAFNKAYWRRELHIHGAVDPDANNSSFDDHSELY